jgi:hypothetical protein
MRKKTIFTFILFYCSINSLFAQETLPNISVKNFNNKIIISWLNDYKKPIESILIQRSFDSLKNYVTIGSVLNPQNLENGYPDLTPPYNKMYYRVLVTFEGGTYEMGHATRPVKEIKIKEIEDITKVPEDDFSEIIITEKQSIQLIKKDSVKNKISIILPKIDSVKIIEIKPIKIIETAYPSNFIFTNKSNNLVLQFTDASINKYLVKFFNANDQLIFELKKISEDFLIIEKSNFIHAGWYRFETYKNGELFEKNKFLISKEKKP